jgi:hypothetical protein
MKTLRAATPEEIEQIKGTADLDANCLVVALDTPKGVIKGVIRIATEVDPVYFPDGCEPRYRLLFMRDVENFLLGRGASNYFFNIHATDETKSFRDSVAGWGAKQVSLAPEYRFRKNLI